MNGNAKITSVQLGYEDHGLLTCWLHLMQDGAGQGFGGYRLDAAKNKDSIYCCFWIRRVLETVGVQNWEDLTGKYIRVDGEEFGF